MNSRRMLQPRVPSGGVFSTRQRALTSGKVVCGAALCSLVRSEIGGSQEASIGEIGSRSRDASAHFWSVQRSGVP